MDSSILQAIQSQRGTTSTTSTRRATITPCSPSINSSSLLTHSPEAAKVNPSIQFLSSGSIPPRLNSRTRCHRMTTRAFGSRSTNSPSWYAMSQVSKTTVTAGPSRSIKTDSTVASWNVIQLPYTSVSLLIPMTGTSGALSLGTAVLRDPEAVVYNP